MRNLQSDCFNPELELKEQTVEVHLGINWIVHSVLKATVTMERHRRKCGIYFSRMDFGSVLYEKLLGAEEKPFFRAIIEIRMNLHAVCPAGHRSSLTVTQCARRLSLVLI